MFVRVEGGTNAGWRTVKQGKRVSWTCSNGHGPNPHYWKTCPVCGEARPQ